ncbi:hypothetical protein BXZ70DRAFT_947304 [Cristinia sonorae]|uniref:TPX2 C-terminal domain-containing protein n=1 Tax=Cristinia sonorae TaxID=1940300 RepID=A0A8K0UKU8_9AGAR|nr:hypothetical protein BXZ70DRAFT_947304 [Cristinia sonorae]
MDISSRHLPDLSDASGFGDYSNTSFQIPLASSESNDLLLADDSDFLHGLDEANTPGVHRIQPRNQAPLTLEELTPRSTRLRFAATPSSFKPRPRIPSPLKPQVTRDLSIALDEALSPLKSQDNTFSIPSTSSSRVNLLTTEVSGFFQPGQADFTFSDEPEPDQESLTLSQLTPGPIRVRQTSLPPSVSGDPIAFPADSMVPSETRDYLPSSTPHDNLETNGSDANTLLASAASPLTLIQTSGLSEPSELGFNITGGVDRSEKAIPEHMNVDSQPGGLRTDTQGKTKATSKPIVIDGGINKRSKPKLPASRLVRDQPQPARKAQSNPAAHGSRMAVRNATERRLTSTSQAKLVDYPAQRDNSLALGGLAATLMSFSERNDASIDHRLRRQGQAESVTEPTSSVPVPANSRNQDIPDTAQTNEMHVFSAETDRDSDQSNEGTQQANAPDCTNIRDLSSRQAISLCEISPSPAEENIRDPASSAVPSSPMRASLKRRSSPGPAEEQPRKKGKNNITAEPFVAAPRQGVAQSRPANLHRPNATQRANAPSVMTASRSVSSNSATRGGTKLVCSTTASTSTRSRVRPAKVTEDKEVKARQRQLTGPDSGASPSSDTIHNHDRPSSAASSTSAVAGRSGDVLPAEKEKETRRLRSHTSTNVAAAPLTRPARKPLVDKPTHPPPKTEKPPFEFTFSVDRRIEGGVKAENLTRSTKGLDEFKRSLKAHGLLPIPDYKKMHSVQEEALAARREQIVPVMPMPLELHTDVRAHERGQFEEGLKARQREAERLAEEKRRVRELEEEREIKELRKRAIPKAHEVPEWYQQAPKKARRVEEDTLKAGSSVSK